MFEPVCLQHNANECTVCLSVDVVVFWIWKQILIANIFLWYREAVIYAILMQFMYSIKK